MHIKEDFPVAQKVVYLDSACMSLKPLQVVNKIREYYEEYTACAGRSHHKLGERVTREVANARKSFQDLISARKPEEIVFTKNSTESINLVANSLSLKQGDIIITSDKEHNSNLLPWQFLSRKKGIKHIIVSTEGDFIANLEEKMNENVKLVSLAHTSNLDGTTIPAKEVIEIAHEHGALVMLDAAQSVPHKEVNVRRLDVDFLAASGHKMLGPTGTGVLYGKEELLEQLEPFIVGGDTVKNTTYESYEMMPIPEKFEAGLQNYAGIIGLGEAVKYLKKIGYKKIQAIEAKVNKGMTEAVIDLGGEIIGPVDYEKRSGIVSFIIKNTDVHQIALLLNELGRVMVRSGMHCVHSWFNAHGLRGSVRASAYLYNDEEDVEKFAETLEKVVKLVA